MSVEPMVWRGVTVPGPVAEAVSVKVAESKFRTHVSWFERAFKRLMNDDSYPWALDDLRTEAAAAYNADTGSKVSEAVARVVVNRELGSEVWPAPEPAPAPTTEKRKYTKRTPEERIADMRRKLAEAEEKAKRAAEEGPQEKLQVWVSASTKEKLVKLYPEFDAVQPLLRMLVANAISAREKRAGAEES